MLYPFSSLYFRLRANQSKNRYTDVLCYDHSRVCLSLVDGDPTSDYINANFVDGYKQKNAFISTQGPLPKTCGDFWRMIWEQQTLVIVMTTRYSRLFCCFAHCIPKCKFGRFTLLYFDCDFSSCISIRFVSELWKEGARNARNTGARKRATKYKRVASLSPLSKSIRIQITQYLCFFSRTIRYVRDKFSFSIVNNTFFVDIFVRSRVCLSFRFRLMRRGRFAICCTQRGRITVYLSRPRLYCSFCH